MSKVNKSWMAVAAAALLLGTLVGAVWARPNEGPVGAEPTRKITLSGADFVPADDSAFWWNNGDFADCDSGSCAFTAPVVFPTLSAVTVERIKLHVADSNGGATVTAYLRRTDPATGVTANLAAVSSSDTGGSLQTFQSGAINKVVWPSQRAYVRLEIGDKYIVIHGVTVEYHRNT